MLILKIRTPPGAGVENLAFGSAVPRLKLFKETLKPYSKSQTLGSLGYIGLLV